MHSTVLVCRSVACACYCCYSWKGPVRSFLHNCLPLHNRALPHSHQVSYCHTFLLSCYIVKALFQNFSHSPFTSVLIVFYPAAYQVTYPIGLLDEIRECNFIIMWDKYSRVIILDLFDCCYSTSFWFCPFQFWGETVRRLVYP